MVATGARRLAIADVHGYGRRLEKVLREARYSPMKILVVAAHPDDEVLGMGGTIARLSREAHSIVVITLADGVTSREGATPADARERQEQAKKALAVLGAEHGGCPVCYSNTSAEARGFPDNRMDTVPLLDVVKFIEKAILKHAPQMVFTHSGGDLNVDHRLTHNAVVTATRPMPGCSVSRVYAFEVPSSTEWLFGTAGEVFRSTTFIDITGDVDAKLAALRCYESELRPFPHPRSEEAIMARARCWGAVAGVEAAEAFELVREVW